MVNCSSLSIRVSIEWSFLENMIWLSQLHLTTIHANQIIEEFVGSSLISKVTVMTLSLFILCECPQNQGHYLKKRG